MNLKLVLIVFSTDSKIKIINKKIFFTDFEITKNAECFAFNDYKRYSVC